MTQMSQMDHAAFAFIRAHHPHPRHQRSPFPPDLRNMQLENYIAGTWVKGTGKLFE
jgi:hypothetical protein